MSQFEVQPGDRIAYSAQFLRSINELSGDLPAARGTVIAIERLGVVQLARIAWDQPDLPTRANVQNLAHVGPNRRFASCD